jgi:hypothetical protein
MTSDRHSHPAKLRRALLSDSGLSLLLHGLKSGLALLVNWLVLSSFPSTDYVTWAVTSSVLVVATASDLGIGQYTTTRLLHTPRGQWHLVLREATAALMPLSLIGSIFVYVALGAQPVIYKAIMATCIGLRILTIPSGALLNAINQFKVRKAIETAVYLATAAVIAALTWNQSAILYALLALNVAFLSGAGLTVVAARRHMPAAQPTHASPSAAAQSMRTVYRTSAPYMVNNLTGLLTYGGFIWLCSFFLAPDALARLSILHTFILINAYQAYDVLLKSRQGDLIHADHIALMRLVNIGLMVLTPIVVLLLGPTLLVWFAPRLSFPNSELLLFSIFISLEFGFLYLQSVIQVDPSKAELLTRCSWIKFTAQALTLCTYVFAAESSDSLSHLLGWLAVTTAIGYVACLTLCRRLSTSSRVRR